LFASLRSVFCYALTLGPNAKGREKIYKIPAIRETEEKTMETKTALNSDTLKKLQQLVQINLDSEKGFNEVSQDIENKSIANVFIELGSQRRKNALELKELMAWNGEVPVEDGSYLAAFHRAWISLRGLLSGGDSHAILSEADRGEDAIKKAYEDVLIATAGSAVNDVLTRQYAIVKAGHDRVRDMRNNHQLPSNLVKDTVGAGAEYVQIEGIRDHMDVIASCGKKVGVVDQVEAETIKLTRKDSPDNLHHYVPTSWVSKVDSRVHLSKNSRETEQGWKATASECGCGTC